MFPQLFSASISSEQQHHAPLVVRQRVGETKTNNYIVSPAHAETETNSPSLIRKLSDEARTDIFSTSSSKVSEFVVSYFTPKGYPHSVSDAKGYASFVQGQMASLVLSTAGGVMSMQALLVAVSMSAGAATTTVATAGSGEVAAAAAFTIPLAATLNWVMKDGLGQLGGVVFASFVSNQFDADPKKWRFIAVMAMECASFIELLTPLAPSYFLLLGSTANIGKNISFLAASASRAAIHKSFAVQENLADVTAKTGSQSIVASVLGTSMGISIAALLQSSGLSAAEQYQTTVLAFCALSLSSMSIHYASLQRVTITTLSLRRLEYLLSQQYYPMIQRMLLASHRLDITDASAAVVSKDSETSASSEAAVASDGTASAAAAFSDEDKLLLTPQQVRGAEFGFVVPSASCFDAEGVATTLHIGSDLTSCMRTTRDWQVRTFTFMRCPLPAQHYIR